MTDLYQGVPRQILRTFPVLCKDKVRNLKLIEWTGIFEGATDTVAYARIGPLQEQA
jgi:hypothetical protein